MSPKMSKNDIKHLIKNMNQGMSLEKAADYYDQSEERIIELLKESNIDVSKLKLTPWVVKHRHQIVIIIVAIVSISTFLCFYKPDVPY